MVKRLLKPRKKRYTPKQVKLPSLLNTLPVPDETVRKWHADTRNRLLRLKLAGINGRDLALLAFSFGQAWLLAEHMDNCDEIRSRIENGIAQLDRNVKESPSILQEEVFEDLSDIMEMTTEVIAASLKIEYIRACDKLREDNAVEFVEAFLVTLAKAKLFEIAHE